MRRFSYVHAVCVVVEVLNADEFRASSVFEEYLSFFFASGFRGQIEFRDSWPEGQFELSCFLVIEDNRGAVEWANYPVTTVKFEAHPQGRRCRLSPSPPPQKKNKRPPWNCPLKNLLQGNHSHFFLFSKHAVSRKAVSRRFRFPSDPRLVSCRTSPCPALPCPFPYPPSPTVIPLRRASQYCFRLWTRGKHLGKA